MKAIPVWGLFILAVLMPGLPMWFTSYFTYTNKGVILISLSVTLLLAVLFFYKTNLRKRILCSVLIIGFLVAVIIKIIGDWQIDPTSHNLFPFELLIDGLLCSFASLIGAAIGLTIKKFTEKKIANNS